MYFSEEQVVAILQSIHRAAKSGRLILTAMEGDAFAGSTWMAKWWLKRRGEPFRWALPPAAAASFFARANLNVLRVCDAKEIRAALPAGAAGRRVASGEFIVVAEW
jgi:O-methyltransferase involved in polyketide biosynthesis